MSQHATAVFPDSFQRDGFLVARGLTDAAGANRSDRVKLSAVSTYHSADNRPIPGTRSDQYPSIVV